VSFARFWWDFIVDDDWFAAAASPSPSSSLR
jgi:hypothetical protein